MNFFKSIFRSVMSHFSPLQKELTDVNRLIANKEHLLRQFPEDNFLKNSLEQFRERRAWLLAQLSDVRRPAQAH